MKTSATIRLSKLLQIVFPEVTNCYYYVDQPRNEEYVRVSVIDGKFFDICVTADSVAALVDDVWKECKRRFA